MWRLIWNYTRNDVVPSLTVFSFFIFRHVESSPMEDHVYASGSSNTSGVLYVHEGPGLYYLKILTANTESYTVTVEYDKDSEVGTGLLMAIIAAVVTIPAVIIILMVIALGGRREKRNRLLALSNRLLLRRHLPYSAGALETEQTLGVGDFSVSTVVGKHYCGYAYEQGFRKGSDCDPPEKFVDR